MLQLTFDWTTAPTPSANELEASLLDAVRDAVLKAMRGRKTIGGIDAEDIWQESLAAILQSAHVENDDPVTIAKRAAWRCLGREQRRWRREVSVGSMLFDLAAKRGSSPFLIGDLLEEASHSLNGLEMGFLELCIEHEIDFQAIADLLKTTPAAVRSKLQRIRGKIGKLYAEYAAIR